MVGGGIGGLTAAAALRLRGWDVIVCERAASLDPVGSGLSLGPNALRALDAIGVGQAARGLAAIDGVSGIRRYDGRWLVRADVTAPMLKKYDDLAVIALRSELVDLLLSRLPEDTVRTSTAVSAVEPETGTVTTSEGALEADLVVAADGVHSGIRKALFPDHPGALYSGSTTWRFIIPEPGHGFRTTESWGHGDVFGIMPLSGKRIYCYASAVASAGQTFEDERAELLRRFGWWHAPIPDLIDAAEPGEILHNDVYWIAEPLPAYHVGRVAFLGDAVHAMSPNLGQGACQAIEDAVVLASLADQPDGLARYTAARLPRTRMVVQNSHRVSRMVGLRSPWATRLRDTLMWGVGRLGSAAVIRQTAPIFEWSPPRLSIR
ncbi:FAD-dependent monooxygenase [Actinocorallia sp. B10E7]|uniref:FAD-dependent monooxygenase n=1 Tax=Actinocorallia sp. B10E7 TaxID=3153558 RepID=UPI00325FA9EF